MPHSLDDLDAFAARVRAARLPIVVVAPGTSWLRLMPARHADPLGCAVGASRFSDPRRGLVPEDDLFRVVYATVDLATAFEEVVLRDRTDGRLPPFAITRAELARYRCAILTVRRGLEVVDLRGSPARRLVGVPTDTVKALDPTLGQRWAYAFHGHDARPDGIVFQSRLTGATNLAIFSRALGSLVGSAPVPLLDFELRPLLKELRVAIVRRPSDAARRGRTMV